MPEAPIGDENASCAPARFLGGATMAKRIRINQTKSLRDRIAGFAALTKEEAEKLPPGPERDAAFRKARQAETGARIDEWINSDDLNPPE